MRRVVTALFLLQVLAVWAHGDQVVLRDGKVIRGRIIDQTADRLTIQISSTITMEVHRERVAEIIREEDATVPSRLAPTPGEERRTPRDPRASAPPSGEERRKRKTVCFAQIQGPMESALLVAELRGACERARDYGADVVVFEVDTPGGRVDVMQEVCALIEDLAPIQTVTYVCGGPEGGAFSAGAVVAVACRETFMAPGTAIGAAAPIRVTKAGVSPVGEKTVSAVTAKVRSLAQKNGYPPEVFAAMVDAEIELRTAKVDGRQTYMSIKPGTEPKREEPTVELGEWITQKGKLLTLTALEATRLGVASKVVDSRRELLSTLGIPTARAIDLNTTKAVQEAVAKRDRYLLELDAMIASYEAKARAIDPATFKYPRMTKPQGFKEKGDFIDGGRLWRLRSDECVELLDRCLEACRRKLALARKYPELRIKTAAIQAKMTELLALRARVCAGRGRRGSER